MVLLRTIPIKSVDIDPMTDFIDKIILCLYKKILYSAELKQSLNMSIAFGSIVENESSHD